jgi:hypothetical protein
MKTLTHLLAIGAALLASAIPMSAEPPPKDWKAWAAWVEKRAPVSDDQGHGPDIGGEEWMAALDRKLGITDAQGHGPDQGSDEWRGAVEHKLAQKAQAPVEQRELLSAHETQATFDGLRPHRCMGLTSLCPDDCGHSGSLATFTITQYLRYEKHVEYGDPKQETFQILIEDNHGNLKVPPAIREAIMALKPGAAVRLDWNHDYVTREGSKSPERVIVKLEPLAAAP